MNILCTQYNKHNGPDATNQHKLEFTVDEAQQEAMYDFIRKVKKGSEVLLLVYITGEDDQEINELATESKTDTRRRLNKRMHALINEIARNKKIKSEKVKDILKEYLIKKKCIVKSSSELDIKGLALAIYYLQTEFSK